MAETLLQEQGNDITSMQTCDSNLIHPLSFPSFPPSLSYFPLFSIYSFQKYYLKVCYIYALLEIFVRRLDHWKFESFDCCFYKNINSKNIEM